MDVDKIANVLYDRNNYSHFVDLLSINVSTEESEQQQQDLNTCELFTFGTFKQYFKYEQKYKLNLESAEKLAKISIIRLSNDYENETLPIEEILQDEKYGLTTGLRLLNELNGSNDDIESALYKLVIELVFQGLVNMTIDEYSQSIIIGEVKLLLDSYDSKYYQLLVLEESADIPNRSLSVAHKNLNQWFNDRLVPLQKETENQANVLEKEQQAKEKAIQVAQNTKKRKSPDNYTIEV
ncbi:uncharacterized protein J8A68_005200 [[Candida] subhashii]|uniref:Uncharacterized protein n=1 Tax=[Candida] subhashii TaxID=561895 RepID=A0A8J5UEN0_9ASCO|nr:uncharacterized protein J8A68_005200 [[Candida] subhashii]KAG7661308.1 hypothetical protein J8A68_005200 [[Candida] subhashii]